MADPQSVSTFDALDDLDIQQLSSATLRNQAADLLRDFIITGKIPSGRKIVERRVAELLGISRSPAREALMQLELEGLIVSKRDARYVVDLTEREIIELHQVRLILERQAVDLAARNTNPRYQAAQLTVLQEMQQAVREQNQLAFARADLNGHALIWEQSENSWLCKTLHTMSGPYYLFMANAAQQYDWQVTLGLHTELVQCINAGDSAGAIDSLERHLSNSAERALGVLKHRQTK
ncbi:MAG: GntR family transcriptional regulator [Chloroflexi bacterium]|nr:GntR family transcriptional regulator [Chloroflexota bacterium]